MIANHFLVEIHKKSRFIPQLCSTEGRGWTSFTRASFEPTISVSERP